MNSAMLLLKAIQDRRPKQARLLLKAGVNVDSADGDGVTALMSVSTLNNSSARRSLVKILLSYQADCNKKDKSGQTALSWACKYGRDDVIHQILMKQSGIDLDFCSDDNEGRSLLFLAASSGNRKVVRQILQPMRKACGFLKMHRPDNHGVRPLVEAFRQGHYECVKILIKEGKASISSLINYLESREDLCARDRFIRDIRNFHNISTRRTIAFPDNEEGLRERDVEEYFLLHGGPTGDKFPPIVKSQLVPKNLKKLSRKAKPKYPVVGESTRLTVKLFSLYAEQCSPSFIKESFPLIRPSPATQLVEYSLQDPVSNSVQSRKNSQTSSTTRYSSLPQLPGICENKRSGIKRRNSVRKTSMQHNMDLTSISRRKRSSTCSMK